MAWGERAGQSWALRVSACPAGTGTSQGKVCSECGAARPGILLVAWHPMDPGRASWRIMRSLTLRLAVQLTLAASLGGGRAARADSAGGWSAAADAPDGTS